MRSFNTLYYLLTVLLIMGAFASMAQNSYGMSIISGVAIAFGLVFGVRFVQETKKNERHNSSSRIEYLTLIVISVIFLLRTLQIYFPLVEWIFALAGITLGLIYGIKAVQYYQQYRNKSSRLGLLLMIAYLVICLFSLAMVCFALVPLLSRFLWILSFILLAGFFIGGLANNKLLVNEEPHSVFAVIAGFRDRFYLLLSLFILFSLYLTLTVSGILPRLYSDKYPQAYYELVNMAESGKEKAVDDKYKYEAFKKAYDQFIEKNISSRKK